MPDTVNKIGLIKLFRELTGASLLDSKDYINTFWFPEHESEQDRETRRMTEQSIGLRTVIPAIHARTIGENVPVEVHDMVEENLRLKKLERDFNDRLIAAGAKAEGLERQLDIAKEDYARCNDTLTEVYNERDKAFDEIANLKQGLGNLKFAEEKDKEALLKNLKQLILYLFKQDYEGALKLVLQMMVPDSGYVDPDDDGIPF